MKFAVYGPFRLPRKRKGMIADDSGEIREFWEYVDDWVSGLPDAIGCYVFCVNSRPWYVGKTVSSFRRECYTDTKLKMYNRAYDKIRKGIPKLFFLAQETRSGKTFRKPPRDKRSRRRLIDNLELMLIGMALETNPRLLNVKDTRWQKNLEVKGFLHSKHSLGGEDARQLRKMFGIGKRK